MREQPEVLALLEGFQGAVADIAPVVSSESGRGLPEQAVGIERSQQLRVFEILAARMFGR
ncbi:MAG: hypothetical protein WDO56_18070 [Gammaproteobacteria bacterium]